MIADMEGVMSDMLRMSRRSFLLGVVSIPLIPKGIVGEILSTQERQPTPLQYVIAAPGWITEVLFNSDIEGLDEPLVGQILQLPTSRPILRASFNPRGSYLWEAGIDLGIKCSTARPLTVSLEGPILFSDWSICVKFREDTERTTAGGKLLKYVFKGDKTTERVEI